MAASTFVWNSVLVDGNWIRYRVSGPVDAPAMVHVHGFAISGTYLLPTAELLTSSFRVYVPDLPGFGRSPRPVTPLGLTELAESLAGFMAALDIDSAVLVGNSLGCAITAELIRLHPDRVSMAVMVGLAGGKQNQPFLRAVGQMIRDGLVEPPKMITVAAPDYLRFGVGHAMRLFAQMTRFPAYERFMSIPIPVMVVIGSEDPLRPSWKRIGRALAEMPPQISVVLFQGAAHAINYSHPRELAHAIRQFVAGDPIRMSAAHDQGVPVLQLLRPV